MVKYQGWSSWNAWNINLYLTNDYNTYKYITDLVRKYGTKKAARIFAEDYKGLRTRDGARYTYRSVLECFKYLEVV